MLTTVGLTELLAGVLVYVGFVAVCTVMCLTAGTHFVRVARELVHGECAAWIPGERHLPLQGRWLRYAFAAPVGLAGVIVTLAPVPLFVWGVLELLRWLPRVC